MKKKAKWTKELFVLNLSKYLHNLEKLKADIFQQYVMHKIFFAPTAHENFLDDFSIFGIILYGNYDEISFLEAFLSFEILRVEDQKYKCPKNSSRNEILLFISYTPGPWLMWNPLVCFSQMWSFKNIQLMCVC